MNRESSFWQVVPEHSTILCLLSPYFFSGQLVVWHSQLGQILEIWKFSLWAVGSCTSGSDGPDGRFTKKRPQPHFTVCSEDLHRSLSWKISVTSTCCALRCWTFLCHLNFSRTILSQLFYDLTSWAEKIDQIFLCVITDLNILFWLKLGPVFLSSKNCIIK
jgi:hypothetical protein